MKYIRHVVSTSKLQTGFEAQVALENKFCNMMRAPYDESFIKHQDALAYYAEKSASKILAYVIKTWLSCAGMWSSSWRNAYFTAGNTTTNRIESNWSQLKAVLGKKTSIDNCVDAL